MAATSQSQYVLTSVSLSLLPVEFVALVCHLYSPLQSKGLFYLFVFRETDFCSLAVKYSIPKSVLRTELPAKCSQ